MKKIFLLLGILILVVLFFGCTQPEGVICEKVEVAKVLEKYPNIELISMDRLSEDNFEEEKEYWQEVCEIEISSGPYYKAIYEEELVKVEVLAEPSKLDIICVIENLKTPILIEEPEIDINQIIPPINTCVENWECGEWSECIDSEQIRLCADISNCKTDINKPIQVQTCVEECEEFWVCFDWSECINGIQTRDCEKVNDCGLNTTQETQKSCE